MLRTIHLYGALAEKYGDKHRLDVKSISEVMRAMEANNPGFLKNIGRETKYEVVRGSSLKGEHIYGKRIWMQYGKGDFHIAPIIEGSGGDTMQWIFVVLGAALIIAGAYTDNPCMISLGVSLMFSGVSMMLSSNPSSSDDYGNQESPEERASFYFSGPTNTMEQGGVLPLVYGRMIIGSTVVSAGIKVESI